MYKQQPQRPLSATILELNLQLTKLCSLALTAFAGCKEDCRMQTLPSYKVDRSPTPAQLATQHVHQRLHHKIQFATQVYKLQLVCALLLAWL